MKEIVLLGSTGSIGVQSLEIVRRNREKYRIKVLTCGHNAERFREQIREFSPELAVTALEEDAVSLGKEFPGVSFMWGRDGLKAAGAVPCDMVINALMGMRGMEPTLAAIRAGNDVALANKETLVAGGAIVMDAVKKAGTRLLPVDSEHSAIFQCIQSQKGDIKGIWLTASGGPFRDTPADELKKVTPAEALKHPNWNMGNKITIDSATMMNKGLEVIEARWLFDLEPDRIRVVVHPESILHSAVEFVDTSVIGQMGLPDMKLPISYALSYPERADEGLISLDFFKMGRLTFERPDRERFPALELAEESIRRGKSYPVVLNGANEVLVQAFLDGRIGFTDIAAKIEEVLEEHVPVSVRDPEDILYIDKETRRKTEENI